MVNLTRAATARRQVMPNPALNPVRFALWTLRDRAAQRQ